MDRKTFRDMEGLLSEPNGCGTFSHIVHVITGGFIRREIVPSVSAQRWSLLSDVNVLSLTVHLLLVDDL